MRRFLQIGLVWVGVVASAPASATSTYMQRLPVSDHFRCLSCHTVQDPAAAQARLNSFGQAFKNNGFRWDAVIARGNADGDNCTNGFELSDQNGDGTLDANTKTERSNPGEPGCALEITPQTWTKLKVLFRQ